MPNSRRNKRIDKKKAALVALGTDPSGLSVLLDLAQESPGQPLRSFIRAKAKEIIVANPARAEELRIDVDEILSLLTEARLRKERLLKAKKDPKIPPFPIPEGFTGRFVWTYKILQNGDVKWAVAQV